MRNLLAGLAIVAIFSMGAAQQQFLISGNHDYGNIPLATSPSLKRVQTQTGPVDAPYATMREDYVQTGLESISIYNSTNTSGTPLATYNDVKFSIPSINFTAQDYTGGYVPTYVGGAGSLVISADGHPNLLTLNWDRTTSSVSVGGGGADRGTFSTSIQSASGELADLYHLDFSTGQISVGTSSSHHGTDSYSDLEIRASGRQATPEPLTLIGLGAGSLGLILRRRKSSR